MKLWERAAEARLMAEVDISEQQNSFMPRKMHTRYRCYICFEVAV